MLPRAPRGSTAGRGRAALGAQGLVLALSGCAQKRLEWVSQPAAGRPASCPDDAIDPTGDRTSPMAARCSYADAPGADTVVVQGKVLREVPGSLALGMAEIEVVLHTVRAGQRGPALARARTDATGNFSLRVRVPAGNYVVVAAGTTSQPFALAPSKAPPQPVVLVPDAGGGERP